MPDHARWMNRCLQLARLGAGSAAPNPLVGAVLVHGERILAEGWHKRAGEPHAEVECLRAFGDEIIPHDATLYVNLEPCAHHGRTPPCADLLIERGVRNVVVAHADPFPAVSGKGIARLKEAGVHVTEGIEEEQARWVNRRSLTSIEQQRPYIVLKWAQSADGLLDKHPRSGRGVQRISDPTSDVLVHRWRAEEAAILVGSRTVLNDNPHLDVRHVAGRSPLRVVLDRSMITPDDSHVFDGSVDTLLFTGSERSALRVEQIVLDSTSDPIAPILVGLQRRSIRSILVEGGGELLGHFIASGRWDEARVITGAVRFQNGTRAPVLSRAPTRSIENGEDRIDYFVNTEKRPAPAWPWC